MPFDSTPIETRYTDISISIEPYVCVVETDDHLSQQKFMHKLQRRGSTTNCVCQSVKWQRKVFEITLVSITQLTKTNT